MVLYGVDRVFMQELDPETMLPPVDEEGNQTGVTYLLKCAESLTAEPQVEEGDETIRTCPSSNAVLAIRKQPDSLYGYDITLTDNEFTPAVFALINGWEVTAGTIPDAVTAMQTPMLLDGTQFKPFRLIVFSSAYVGDDVTGYAMFVFNRCRGTASTIDLQQDFWQPEYTIQAREATRANLPMASYGFYNGTEPPDSLEGITITSLTKAQSLAAGFPSGIAVVSNKDDQKKIVSKK